MKYALLIIEAEPSRTDELKNVLNNLESFQSQFEALNVGAYMLPLKDGLTALYKLLTELETRKFSSRVLFFDSDPAWVKTTPKK